MGVEEEYFLVHPGTRAPQPAGSAVAAHAARSVGDLVTGEFTEYQVEVRTPPRADAAALCAELVRLRGAACAAARTQGLRLCASGTAVAPVGTQALGDHPRYREGVAQYRAMLDDFAICALHVHAHCPDREAAVLVSNHLRPWLPLLVAMAANSPFHHGRETGYASWRAVIRSRFPCLGPPPYAESVEAYERMAEAMERSEAMLDARTPFWDIRPNSRFPTVEIRCMDVLPDIEDTVALAVLVRALVVAGLGRVRQGDPGPRPSAELLRAAYWRAARDGWTGSGVDPLDGRVAPFSVQAGWLVEEVRPVLEGNGDLALVRDFLRRLGTRGGGAERQRAAESRHGGLNGVVDDLVRRTARAGRTARTAPRPA